MAHGELPPDVGPRTLVAIFASPVADYLLHFGRDVGYRTVLLDPDANRLAGADWSYADQVTTSPTEDTVDHTTDVVVTDHDRAELGAVLRATLLLPARWIGVMGSVRHTAPHLAALSDLGVSERAIARIHRPIGLNIGSKTPAEIAVATLAGLIADRNHRPGGLTF